MTESPTEAAQRSEAVAESPDTGDSAVQEPKAPAARPRRAARTRSPARRSKPAEPELAKEAPPEDGVTA